MAQAVDKSLWLALCKFGGLLRKTFLMAAAVLVCHALLCSGECRAQLRKPAGSDSPEQTTVQPGQGSATIGSSGFKVPIPEIKMKRIIGDQPRRETPQAKPKEEEPVGIEAPSAPVPEETAPPSQIQRLPFDPVEPQPVRGPRKGPRRGPALPPKEPARPVARPELPVLPPAEEVTEPSAPPKRGPSRGPALPESTSTEEPPATVPVPATPQSIGKAPAEPALTEQPAEEHPPAERPSVERQPQDPVPTALQPPEPASEEHPPEKPQPAEHAPTETAPTAPTAPPAEVEPKKTAPVPEETESPSPERQQGVQKESLPDLLKPPRAPEDTVKPPPRPKKEILKAKPAALPTIIMKAPRSKEERKAMTVDRAETDEMADPREWIKLEERRDPEVIPPPEPEPAPETSMQPEVLPGHEPVSLPETQSVPEPKLQTPPQPETVPQPEPEAQPEQQPVATPEPQPEQQPIVKPEPTPTVPPEPAPSKTPESEPMPVPEQSPLDSSPKESLPAKPGAEPPVEKETLPPVPEPPPVREIVPSPLEDNVLESREVRDYLKRAAPILEELSLLMARAPQLTIADYDPSDPNAPAVPGDVHPKMDSMKRTLQILDSKAFEIIPPKKYIPFHGLIRESIAETFKACEAITVYLDSNNPEDLRGVQDHLIKARELIRQTRERTQSG